MKHTLLVSILSLCCFMSTAGAGDAELGKAKSIVCVSCHGTNGISNVALYPDLAGQKYEYLVKSMKAYKDGSRSDPVMASVVSFVSEADIENLAAYYSSLSCHQ